MHYCRGWSDHCVEVCLSRGRKGWNKCPGSEATVGQSAGLIWKDSCNYESLEETAVWQIQCANTTLTVRKVHYTPHPPVPRHPTKTPTHTHTNTHTKRKMLGQYFQSVRINSASEDKGRYVSQDRSGKIKVKHCCHDGPVSHSVIIMSTSRRTKS